MSDKPKSSAESPSINSTRQLLDELDALMQRMLSLPVQQDNEEPLPPLPTPLARSTLVEEPMLPLPPRPAALEELPPLRTPPSRHTTLEEPPPIRTPLGKLTPRAEPTRTMPALPRSAPPLEPLPGLDDEMPRRPTGDFDDDADIPLRHDGPSVLRPIGSDALGSLRGRQAPGIELPQHTPTPPPEPVLPPPPPRPHGLAALVLWPLTLTDQLYELVTGLLGAPGRWLRGTGRALLGWTGVLLLVAACGWQILLWLGWSL